MDEWGEEDVGLCMEREELAMGTSYHHLVVVRVKVKGKLEKVRDRIRMREISTSGKVGRRGNEVKLHKRNKRKLCGGERK